MARAVWHAPREHPTDRPAPSPPSAMVSSGGNLGSTEDEGPSPSGHGEAHARRSCHGADGSCRVARRARARCFGRPRFRVPRQVDIPVNLAPMFSAGSISRSTLLPCSRLIARAERDRARPAISARALPFLLPGRTCGHPRRPLRRWNALTDETGRSARRASSIGRRSVRYRAAVRCRLPASGGGGLP
jgi:hypothetical protein